MRPLVCAACALLTSGSFGQNLQGLYHPGGKGVGVPWQINPHSTLVWDNAPYLPVGIHVEPTQASIKAAKAAGFHDVLVDLPATDEGWDESLAALESAGLRYLIRVSSLTPMARGVAVDPAAYRLTDVKGPKHVDVVLPDATEALVVMADKRDGSVEGWSRVPVSNGRLVYDAKAGSAEESVILIYPVTVSLEQPDYWEGMDGHRDHLLLTLKRHAPGAGLRGIVNPLGRSLSLPGRELRFVPNSAAFRAEFAQFLESKYRNVVSALRSWSLSSEVVATSEVGEAKDAIESFQDLAAFVPLWSGSRGVSQIWDPVRNRLYGCQKGRSTIWRDYSEAVNAAESRRFSRMVDAIRQTVDVPVVQEWAGWAQPYETADPTVDGIGMKASGASPTAILGTAAKSASSMLRWPKPGWLPATEIDLDGTDAAPQVTGVMDDLLSLGARGVFFRSSTPAVVKAAAAEAERRIGETAPANGSPQAIFFPENATNPAVAQRLPGGRWWLPCPADGNRLDFGEGFFGYRMSDRGTVTTTLWCKSPQRVLLHFAAPQKVLFLSCDGSDPKVKIVKGGVELNMSEFPLVVSGTDEIPIPDPSYQRTSAEIATLLKAAEERRVGFSEETMTLTEAYKSFDRNPGGTFPAVRQVAHLLDFVLGNFTWTEAEKFEATNFSEVQLSPGCSGGGALALHSAIPSGDAYYADYTVPVRTTQDQQLWLAARIPPEQRDSVSVRIGSQIFGIAGPPIGLYGSGFGWYHLGVTRLLGQEAKLRVQVTGSNPDLALDSIVLAPDSFHPDGVTLPEPAAQLPMGKPTKGPKGDTRSQVPPKK